MKLELEQKDIQLIAESVASNLKHLFPKTAPKTVNEIMDIKQLCEYLKVKPKWVYERTHLKEIPYFKISNKQIRFRKKEIDDWLESHKRLAMNH